MKYYLKHKEHYFPYKIFQKNNQTSNSNVYNYNNSQFPMLHKKIVIDISKNLKSVAISNKLFSNYMEYYNNLTQNYCFKTPDKDSYPLRKNIRYLSAESIKNLADKSNNSYKMKLLKRPISVKSNLERLKLFHNNKINNNSNKLMNKIKKRNNNTDLLFSFSEGKVQKNFTLTNLSIKDNSINNIDLDNNKNIKEENFEYLNKFINININNLNESNNINEFFDKTKLSLTNYLSKENIFTYFLFT